MWSRAVHLSFECLLFLSRRKVPHPEWLPAPGNAEQMHPWLISGSKTLYREQLCFSHSGQVRALVCGTWDLSSRGEDVWGSRRSNSLEITQLGLLSESEFTDKMGKLIPAYPQCCGEVQNRQRLGQVLSIV